MEKLTSNGLVPPPNRRRPRLQGPCFFLFCFFWVGADGQKSPTALTWFFVGFRADFVTSIIYVSVASAGVGPSARGGPKTPGRGTHPLRRPPWLRLCTHHKFAIPRYLLLQYLLNKIKSRGLEVKSSSPTGSVCVLLKNGTGSSPPGPGFSVNQFVNHPGDIVNVGTRKKTMRGW